MRRALMAVACGIGMIVAAYLTWPNWTVLADGYGHRGFYRCSVTQSAGSTQRECWTGADELVLREISEPSGEFRSSWYVGGAYEYARSVRRPNGHFSLHRSLGNSWSESEGGDATPEGRSPCMCGAARLE